MVTKRNPNPQKRGRKTKRGQPTKHKTLRVPEDRYNRLQALRPALGPKATLTDAAVAVLDLGFQGGPGADAQRVLAHDLDVERQDKLRVMRDAARAIQDRDRFYERWMDERRRKEGLLAWILKYVPVRQRRGLDLRGIVKPFSRHELQRLADTLALHDALHATTSPRVQDREKIKRDVASTSDTPKLP